MSTLTTNPLTTKPRVSRRGGTPPRIRSTQLRQRNVPRMAQIIARLRRRQLETAIAGRITDSARYAHRVQKLMRIAC